MVGARRIISLFSGAGGLDLGFETAGFATAVAVEMDPVCCATLRCNRDWPIIDRDIHEVSSDEILDVAELTQGHAAALVGGPPCQPFSKSGFWATGDSKRLKDPRAKTLDAYLRVLEDTLPATFLLENVAGIAYQGKSEGIEFLRSRISEINRRQGSAYGVEPLRLNSASFGVPQVRERLIIVGHRDGLPFGNLSPTHRWQRQEGEQLNFPELDKEEATNAWDAIGHLTPSNLDDLALTGKWADLVPSIPEGENYLFHTERGNGVPLFGWRRRFWNFLLKLAKDKPSWTLTAQPGPATGPFHWDNRLLSPEELGALQTFPADFNFCGSRTEAQRQIGNAVPSALAELIALRFRSRFFGECSLEGRAASLVPEKRSDLPGPAPTAPVPQKYLALAGDHDAHPGTGKGYGATRLKANA